jgi:dTDP-4-amino-4,6-dideoxygalactose transaminase
MYRKTLQTGSQGGLIYTNHAHLRDYVISLSDRGKLPSGDLHSRTPGKNLFLGLNWNTSEIACAIGIKSLAILDSANSRRRAAASGLSDILEGLNIGVCPVRFSERDAPFFLVCKARSKLHRLKVSKFLEMNAIPHNPDYDFLIHRWLWVQQYLDNDQKVPQNADKFQQTTLNIYLNEKFNKRNLLKLKAAMKVSVFK